MSKISLCYVTGRREPRWEWFVDSICAQTTAEQRDNIQFVFVDGCLWTRQYWDWNFLNGQPSIGEISFSIPAYHDAARRDELARVIAQRFDYLHIPPKPCAWQGPFRQTSRDFFCASNTRNTAFVVAQHPYLVFVDDLSVLGPLWFNQVRHAVIDEYVVCGAYKKVKQLKVTDGRIESFEPFPSGVDSRWDRGSDGGVVPWHGGGMYGCSFGLPLEAALEVDGNDAACNGQGGEDTDFGIRLQRAGWPVFFNRNMCTLESEELHHDGSKLPQERKLVTADRLPKNYDSYQHAKPDEKYWSDHVMLNRLCNETDRIQPLIGDNLRTLRAHYQTTGCVPIPRGAEVDWRDGIPLSDL